jgi:hypothetical protein
MKRILLGVIALTMAGSPAAAADRLPAKFMGNWCMVDPTVRHDGKWSYDRATSCSHGFWQRLRADGLDGQDGLDGPASKCKLLQIIVIKPNDDYVAKFHCSSEGQSYSAVYRLSLKGPQLIVTALD